MSDIALVTGGSGWLGRALIRALREGLPEVKELHVHTDREIRCLVTTVGEQLTIEALFPNVSCVRGNICDPQSLEKFFHNAKGATLFHCAGIIHPKKIADLYRVNCEGTENVIEAANKSHVERLIFISSNSPFGYNRSNEEMFDEQSCYDPYMNYGKSKQIAEEYVRVLAGKHMPTTILRPTWFYGPGQPARQTTFFSMIRQGKMPLTLNAQNRRSMAYIDNICQAILRCERHPATFGQSYWIADQRPYSMHEIVTTISELLTNEFEFKTSAKQIHLPDLVFECAYIMDKLIQRTGRYHQSVHVLSEMNKTIACSISKAEQEFGYAPHIELQEGMRRSILSLLRRGETF